MPDYPNYNPFPNRKHPRLRYYDYTANNYYFVTICTADKRCLFGTPGKFSQAGMVAAQYLEEIPQHFPGISVNKWVVMPNHVHAIIVLAGSKVPLPTVIGQYKAAVTKEIHKNYPQLTIWQSSFHDHIIRNDADYQRIWSYIDTNPARWTDDCFYTTQYE